MSRKGLIDLLVLLLIALVIVGGYKYAGSIRQPSAGRQLEEQSCDLQRQSCLVALPEGGQVTVSFNPQPAPLLKPFRVDVRLLGVRFSQASMSFAGVEMDMGVNQLELLPEGQDVFGGVATLPLCVTGRMRWRATLQLDGDGQRLLIPFVFDSDR